MKYSSIKSWNIEDEYDGVLYFAHRVEEMLFDYSISLNKVPLLNTNNLISEYCDVYNQVQAHILKEDQLRYVFEEMDASFSVDIVLKECWGINSINRMKQKYATSNTLDRYKTIHYLKSYLNDGTYYDWCVRTIRKYMFLPKEKKKLEQVIRCWLPELISKGYDEHYIYTLIKKLFFGATPVSIESIDIFFNKFNFKTSTYRVYFAIPRYFLSYKKILEKRLKLQFEPDDNFKKMRKDRKHIIVYFKGVKSLCSNQAAQIAYNRFNMFITFYKFVGDKTYFNIQNKAMVANDKMQTDVEFVDFRKNQLHIIQDKSARAIGEYSDKLITGILLNAKQEYNVLHKALELHNAALSASDINSAFVNLWSAIEVICSDRKASGKIDEVRKVLIAILVKDYLEEYIQDILSSIEKNISTEYLEEILGKINEAGCITKKGYCLLLLEEYSNVRDEVYQKLKDYPVIRSRIFWLSDLKTTKNLRGMVTKYEQLITWNVCRMYRVRNGIVHSGSVPYYLKYLAEHLHSYLDSALNEFTIKLAGGWASASIGDVLVDINLLSENLMSALADAKKLDVQIICAIIHPEITHAEECDSCIHRIDSECTLPKSGDTDECLADAT